jgi:trimeric autotransporter adhesin
MKKHLQLLLLLFTSSFISEINAQIFFTETFEGTMGANGIPAGWEETGLSTDGIFAVGNDAAASSYYFTFPAAIEGTRFAYTNDDVCNCNKSVDRLILPAQDFTGMAGVSLIFDLYHTGAYGGVATVEVSTTGSGGPWTTVATLPESGAWQNDLVTTLVDYAGLNNVTIAFRYNDAATWAGGMGVDDVRLEQLVTLSPDMELSSANADEYTIVPFTQITPSTLSAVVTNVGSAITTDAALTVNVYAAPNLITPIQTTSSDATTVNTGATANLTAGTFTPTALGSYLFEYIVSATGDANAVNDTLYSSLIVDPSVYARDDSAPSSSFGIGAGTTGYIGYKFDIVATTPLDSVFGLFNKPGTDAVSGDGVGDVTRFVIYDVVGGLPSTIIGTSDIYTFTAADTLGLAAKTFAIQATGGGQLTLTAGTYFVAVEENNTNVGFTFTDNNFQPTTFYISWTTQPWTAAEGFPAQFQKVPLLRPILGCVVPTASTTTIDAGCGQLNGSATVTPTSGLAPFDYLWDDGQTAATANNLGAGVYSVTITDALGCSAVITGVTVVNPPVPTASTTTIDAGCGQLDGSATVTPTSGLAPFDYLWNDGQTAATANNLGAGDYSVTITDALGCSAVITGVTVANPNSPTSSISVISNYNGAQVTCAGESDGEANVTASGGNAPYVYLWSNGQITATASNLAAGTYQVTVTDNASCSSTSSITITEPTALTSSADLTDIGCNGDSTGAINLSVTGGTAGYSFVWDNGALTQNLTGLSAGSYSAEITDLNGCSLTVGPLTVSEPNVLSFTVTSTDVTVAGGTDGAIDLTVSGGTSPYTYLWNNSETTEDLSGLPAGTYICTITDANGCTSEVTVTILDGVASLANNNTGMGVISLFPNPATEEVTLSFDLTQNSDITIEVVSTTGQVLLVMNDVDVLNTNYVLNVSEWSTGVYFVKVKTTDGMNSIRFVKK